MNFEPSFTGLGFPSQIQNIFYAIAALPAILGVVLLAAGIYIVVKYRHDGDQEEP